MENLMIGTLPIKPQEKTNIGMLIAPTVMDYIGRSLGIRRIMSINTLNSYSTKESQKDIYLQSISESFISYDSLFIDKDYVEELVDIVEDLYYRQILKAEYKNVMRCDCGRVDFLCNSIKGDTKLFEERDGKFYCKACHGECKLYKEHSLILQLDKNVDDEISIVPKFLKSELFGFSKSFKGTSILVSKQRDTGYYLDAACGKFNIDIDFLWMNFFNLFPENNQIFIASNHQLLIMYLMNYYSKLTSNKNLHFIATPYIRGDLRQAMSNYKLEAHDISKIKNSLEAYKKLFILYQLKWGKKDCELCNNVYNYLCGISGTKLNNLYRTILNSTSEILRRTDDISLLIEQALKECTSMQENISMMKRYFKEGKL